MIDANSDNVGAQTSTGVTSSINLTAVNDTPVLTAGASLAYTENATATVIDNTITLTDADDTQIVSANVSIGNFVSGDTLGFVNQNGIIGSYDSNTGVLTLTGLATKDNYLTALHSVTYLSSSENPTINGGNTSRTITWTVTDANSDGVGAATGGITSIINITPVNDAPIGTSSTVTIAEDSSKTFVASDFGFVDLADGHSLNTVIITSLPNVGTLRLNGVTVIVDQSIAVANIGLLVYTPVTNANGTSYATIGFKVQDNGGATNGGVDTSVTANTLTIDVTAVNDAPVASGSATLSAIDEDTSSPSGATVDSLFSSNFSDSTDAISNGSSANSLAGIAINSYTSDSSKGAWQYSSDNSTWTALSTIVTVDASAISLKASDYLRFVPIANYNGAATPLTARLIDSSTTISTSGGTLDVSSNGGTTAYSSGTVTLGETITAVNDAPTATNLSVSEAFTEDDAAFSLTDIVISDIDSATVTASLTLSNSAAGSISTGTASGVTSTFSNGVWTASGAIDSVNTLLATAAFTPATNFDQNFTINTSVSDGIATAITGSKVVTVTAVNDAPVLNVGIGYLSFDGSTRLQAAINEGETGISREIVFRTTVGGGLFEVSSVGGAYDRSLLISPATGQLYSRVWSEESISGGSSLKDDSFHTILFTLGITGGHKIYVDGTLVATGIKTSSDFNWDTIQYIGWSSGIGGSQIGGYFQGDIQSYRAWNTELTANQARADASSLPIPDYQFLFNGMTSQSDLIGITLDTGTFTLGGKLIYQENAGEGIISDNLTLTDVDDTDITQARVWISNHFVVGDILSFTPVGNITLDYYDSATGVLALKGTDTLSNYKAALSTVTYRSISDNPTAGGYTTRTVSWTVTDANSSSGSAGVLSSTIATATINITAVNDAPSGTSAIVTIVEDGSKTFAASDFGFVDLADSHSLSAVIITSLPSVGTLMLNGVAVIVDQSIAVADISNLVYTPVTNANGTSYATIGFKVQDNGGTANGGADTSVTANTLTIDVTAVNDAPIGTSGTITIVEDGSKTFATSDFGFVDSVDGHGFNAVIITSLPSVGSLTLNGSAVSANQSIAFANIDQLVYTPAANANGISYATIGFKVQDTGGTTNGGVDTSVSANTLTIDVTALNDAPVGTPATVTRVEVGSKTFAASAFGFVDSVENNTLQAVIITSLPSVGTLTLNSTAVSASQSIAVADIGLLVYRPAANGNATSSYATIGFKVQDNGGTANGGVDTSVSENTLTINVTSENDAPVASGSATLIAINEDTANPTGATVDSLFSSNFSDSTDTVSNGSSANTLVGIAINSYTPDSSKGVWQYSSDGASWTGLTIVSSESTAISLKAADYLRFVPTADYNGAATTLTARLIETPTTLSTGGTLDVSSNGGITAYSSGTVTLGETITAVNDAPTATNLSASEAFTEDGAAFSLTDIVISDIDSANVTAILSLSSSAAGTISTDTASGVTSTFSNGVWTASGALANVNTLLIAAAFTPAPNYDQSFTISSSVSDGSATITGSKAVSVTAVNDAPTAGGAVTVTAAGSSNAISITEDATPGTTANIRLTPPTQTDVDTGDTANQFRILSVTGGTLTQGATLITLGSAGDILTLSSGSLDLVFTPDLNRDLPATFSYVMVDDSGTNSTPSTATIAITAVPDAPVVYVDSPTTNEDTLFNGSVPTATDVDSLPEVQETGAIDYAQASRTYSFMGSTSNEYGVSVNSGATGFATIQAMATAFQQNANYGSLPYTIGVNTAGDGLRLTFKTIGDFATRSLEKWGDNGVPLTNVTPVHSFTYARVGNVDKGTLTFDPNGSYTFDPRTAYNTLAAGQNSSTSFTYQATDATSLTSTPQTVTITVTGVNDAPGAMNDSVAASEAGGVSNGTAGTDPTGNVLINDTDVDAGFTHTVSAVRTGSTEGAGTTGTVGSALVGSYGSLTLASDGSYTYTVDNSNTTVNALAVGGTLTDSFNYTVSDGSLTDIGVLAVTISGANDTPVMTSGTIGSVA
ncbi:MAG: Ig-like domain-containing protein, partial [Methylococcaceae bacterium]